MGCFIVLKRKKKKTNQIMYSKRVCHDEHEPTALPEPQTPACLLSAPPSFKSRVKSIHAIYKDTNNRARASSAPSALDVADHDALASAEYEAQEESNYRTWSMKEQHSSKPQPLPLPSCKGGGALKVMGSFKSRTDFGPLYAYGVVIEAGERDTVASVKYENQEESKHQVGLMKEQRLSNPQPLPLPPTGFLRNFSYEEIAAACRNFSSDQCMSEGLSSTMYKASFGGDASSVKKFEATVTHLQSSAQGLKDFINDVNIVASLQHPNLCKLLGFHGRDGSERRMLVYERLCHGSLNRLLFGRSDGPSVDWNTRMKIAICAAQGLTFLHEEGPFHAMYNEFSTANIQIDKDFSAKLSGYGCVGPIPEEEISSNSCAVGNLSVETLERGILTPKSNVWSFGIILLELLTGRKNLDSHLSKEERNLVKWSRPFLADDLRLSLIMDPQLKGRFPLKAARAVADIAQKCLQREPSERPTMRTIVEHLKMIQDMKHSCWFPLQEPAAMSSKQMSRSPSLNGVTCHAPRLSIPTLHLPLHVCSSTSLWRNLVVLKAGSCCPQCVEEPVLNAIDCL